MDIAIRPALPEHFAALRAIELAAFETLRDAGAVAGEACAASLDDFNDFSRDGLLLAAFTSDAVPVGFVAARFEAKWLHIAEIDVHPDWQRHGAGRLLMQAAIFTGQQRGLLGATLTTDSLAAFNARFYASLGFEIVEGHSRPTHLVSLNTDEIAQGFNPTRRVTMLMTWQDVGRQN